MCECIASLAAIAAILFAAPAAVAAVAIVAEVIAEHAARRPRRINSEPIPLRQHQLQLQPPTGRIPMKITTRLQAADIWTAIDDDTYDGPDCPIGVGRSEAAAIADLMGQIEEKAHEITDAALQDAHDRRLHRRED